MSTHIHNSFDMVSPLRDILPKRNVSATVTETPIGPGNKHCPSHPKGGRRDILSERSVCPWYHVKTSDPARFPQDLTEARCRCSNCLLDDRVTSACEKVYFPLRVLRMTGNCVQGLYEYEESWEQIAVGCTCALHRTFSHRRS